MLNYLLRSHIYFLRRGAGLKLRFSKFTYRTYFPWDKYEKKKKKVVVVVVVVFTTVLEKKRRYLTLCDYPQVAQEF